MGIVNIWDILVIIVVSYVRLSIWYIYIYGIHIYILYNHKSIDGMYPLVMTHGLLENPRTK